MFPIFWTELQLIGLHSNAIKGGKYFRTKQYRNMHIAIHAYRDKLIEFKRNQRII